MTHKLRLFLMAVGCLLLLACGGGSTSSDGKVTMKVASVLPAEHPTSQALEFFKQRVGELSQGSMEVRLFPNSQLGNVTETIESCQGGNIEMVFASTAPMASFIPEFNVFGMPFIFRDKQHEYAVVDGEIGAELSSKLEGIGLVGLCYFDAGSRNIMTMKGPIRTPDDLKGMKIRVMSSKLMTDTINTMGASAVPMGQGEVYGALQTGVLDGWENNPPTALSFKMYETGCEYFAWTRHLAVPDMLLMNSNFFKNLSPENQEIIRQAAKETVAKQRELWQADEAKSIEALKGFGMQFNEVDSAAFAKRTEPLYEEKYAEYGPEFEQLCERIRSIQ